MKTITEKCPYCELEVGLQDKFELQSCPVCGNIIAPCSICAHIQADVFACQNCPLLGKDATKPIINH